MWVGSKCEWRKTEALVPSKQSVVLTQNCWSCVINDVMVNHRESWLSSQNESQITRHASKFAHAFHPHGEIIMANTPVKVYGQKLPDSCCRLCGFDFAAKGIRPPFQLFSRARLPGGKEEFLLKLMKTIEENIVIQNPALSSVSCKSCHMKVNKFWKIHGEIEQFKSAIISRDEIHLESLGDGKTEAMARIKRCSKSPHHEAIPRPRLGLLPTKSNCKLQTSNYFPQ